jgi:hypothetical protein
MKPPKKSFSAVVEAAKTADPSTTLRSGRDDKGRGVVDLCICYRDRKVGMTSMIGNSQGKTEISLDSAGWVLRAS